MTESSDSSGKGPLDHFAKDGQKFMSAPPELCIHNIMDPLKNVLGCKNGHLKNIKCGQFNGKDLPNWLELGRIGAIAAIPLMCVSVCVCAHGYLCACVCEGARGSRTCPITAIHSRELSLAAIQFIYFICNIMLQ